MNDIGFRGIWSYGLLSYNFDTYATINYNSKVLGVSSDIKGLNKSMKQLLNKCYEKEIYIQTSVVLFKVKDINPDLITWDILKSMSQAEYIYIVHNSKFKIGNQKYKIVRNLINNSLEYEFVITEENEYEHLVYNKTRRELLKINSIPVKFYRTISCRQIKRLIHRNIKQKILNFLKPDVIDDCLYV